MLLPYNGCVVSKYGHSCMSNTNNFEWYFNDDYCIISVQGHSCLAEKKVFFNMHNMMQLLCRSLFVYSIIAGSIVVCKDIQYKMCELKSLEYLDLIL